ncbi:MAG: Gfo/Idh/MocA family oxidoreductase [Marinilabiliales bacterium]|nr:Gfo/Idh/MocA family oxidoreductase [Marinilabiliales bacterium]
MTDNTLKPIVTALCSFGMSGQVFHGPSLKILPQYKIHKILERHQRISEKHYPQAIIVQDYEKILHDPIIELVIVNTPDYLHFEMAKKAMEAGKHVVVEKPFVKYSEEARKLIEIAKKNEVLLTVYQNRRLDGGFRTVQKVLENNLLGRIVEYECHYDRYRNFIQEGSWKEDGDERTGVLFNLGSHIVDQALVLLGKPLAVTAHLSVLRTGGRTTDHFDIRLHYKTFDATLRCSYLVREMGPQFIIHGTEGSFTKMATDPQEELLKVHHLPDEPGWGKEPVSDWGTLNTTLNGLHVEGKIETIPGNYADFYKNLYGAIRLGEKLLVKPEEALMTIRILEACLTSNREKRTVEFN